MTPIVNYLSLTRYFSVSLKFCMTILHDFFIAISKNSHIPGILRNQEWIARVFRAFFGARNSQEIVKQSRYALDSNVKSLIRFARRYNA